MYNPAMGRRFVRLAVTAAAACALQAIAPRAAWADESTAEQLFQEGLAAMERKDYRIACEAFAKSNTEDPSPGTQINLGLCYEKQKKWASAWTWYRSAAGSAQARRLASREKIAEDAANRVKSKIHYVVVSVREPLSDLSVRRDGDEITIALAGKELPLPTDPGEHTFEVAARGKKPWSTVLKVADDSATDRIEVPRLEDAPVEEKAADPDPRSAPLQPNIVVSDGSGQRTVGVVVGGAGILTALAGVGVFVLAQAETSKRDDERALAQNPPPGDDRDHASSAKSHDDAAHRNQLIAIMLGSGGAVLVGVGAVLYFTAKKHDVVTARPTVVPLVAPTFAGLGLGGAF
jgi:tetratricopeptide (TPR) repeat protein